MLQTKIHPLPMKALGALVFGISTYFGGFCLLLCSGQVWGRPIFLKRITKALDGPTCKILVEISQIVPLQARQRPYGHR